MKLACHFQPSAKQPGFLSFLVKSTPWTDYNQRTVNVCGSFKLKQIIKIVGVAVSTIIKISSFREPEAL